MGFSCIHQCDQIMIVVCQLVLIVNVNNLMMPTKWIRADEDEGVAKDWALSVIAMATASLWSPHSLV